MGDGVLFLRAFKCQLGQRKNSNVNEVDIVLEQGREIIAIEVKSASTWTPTMLKSLKRFAKLPNITTKQCLVYSGDAFEFSDGTTALNFSQVEKTS